MELYSIRSFEIGCWSCCIMALCACKVTQWCRALCDPLDCSPPGSSVHGNFLARVLERVANFLLHGIFPTQRLNPHLLCPLFSRQLLYTLSCQGSPIWPWDPSKLLPVSTGYSFLLLSDIEWYGCTTVCLTIWAVKNIWIVFQSFNFYK